MPRTPASVTVEVAETGALTGLFTLDESLLDGDDVLAGDFNGSVFDDLTSRDLDMEITISRGAGVDLGGINAGTSSVLLSDPDGDFNPENPNSPIADTLDVMRPERIRATHPDVFKDYEQTVLNDNPSIYLRLGRDDIGGTVAHDRSSGGNNGTYVGGVTLNQSGALTGDPDTAALFDGSTGYVNTGLTTNPATAAAGGGITVELWAKPASVAASRGVLSQQDGGGTGRTWLQIAAGAPTWQTNAGGSITDSGVTAVVGRSDHLVITVLGTTLSFYVNGALATSSTRTIDSAVGSWLIATNKLLSSFFNVTVDEFALYPSALSAARVLAHYQAGKATGGDLRTVGLYYGWLRDIEHDPDLSVRKSVLNAVDLFEWLGLVMPVIASTGPISEGAAIGLVLDAAQWTDPALRDLDTGGMLADFSADGTQSGIALITGITAVSLGLFFATGESVARYISRENRFAPQAPVATLNGSLITGVRPRKSVDQVRNRITVTREGGTPQTAVNEESRRKYGYRDMSPITSPYFVSDADALGLANLLVALYGTPRSPIREAQLINRDDESIVQQLEREIGDRVTVTEASGGTDAEGEIVGIQHRLTQASEHRTRFLVSGTTASLAFFTFDDDTGASVLDGTAVLAA